MLSIAILGLCVSVIGLLHKVNKLETYINNIIIYLQEQIDNNK